jgi:hypothetical protein
MSERPANRTAFGYAPGTEPARPGATRNPQVPTVPPGQYTARGRIQAMLGGMREQIRWRHDQAEMDRPIPPPEPEYVHNGAAGRYPPKHDLFSQRTYDSITPREALRREKNVADGLTPEGVPPEAYGPKRSPAPAQPEASPAPVPAPADRTGTPEGRTSGGSSGAVVVRDGGSSGTDGEDDLTEFETMSDDQLEERLSGIASEHSERSELPRAPARTRAQRAPSSPTSAAGGRANSGPASAPAARPQETPDLDLSKASDKQIFQELEAAFDRVKSRARRSGSDSL